MGLLFKVMPYAGLRQWYQNPFLCARTRKGSRDISAQFINTKLSFVHSFIHSFIHSAVSYKPLPKRLLHTVRSSASSFNFQCLLSSLRSSSSCLRLLPRLPVISILPSNFPSITCFRRQFLRKMWPIQLAFLLFIVLRIFLSSYRMSKLPQNGRTPPTLPHAISPGRFKVHSSRQLGTDWPHRTCLVTLQYRCAENKTLRTRRAPPTNRENVAKTVHFCFIHFLNYKYGFRWSVSSIIVQWFVASNG
jgi:hypothetical protein